MVLKRQAVLFRSSHHADVLELELVRRNIPYVKYGGLKFLEAAHVKDLLAVLRWADNPRNRVAAFRVLQLLPGIGPARAERVCTRFEAGGWAWNCIAEAAPPAEGWSPFVELMAELAVPEGPWQGQVGRVREWYEPHLERLYDAAQVRAGDLVQLERIAQQFATREQFLTRAGARPAAGDRRSRRRAASRRGLAGALHRAFREGAGVGCRARAERLRRQLSRRSSRPAEPS